MKKKGLFITIIFIIVAIVLAILFINLFTPKDTKSVAKRLNTTVENGYLSSESDEYKTIMAYLQDISTKLTNNSEINEVKNYINSYEAFVVMGKFFNKQIVFTKYSGVYNDNRNGIEKGLSKAQSEANSFASYIKENKQVVGGSEFWLVNTWANCEDYMKNLVNSSINVFNRLGDVYQGCVYSKVMNNSLTDLIFDAVEELSVDIETKPTDKSSYGSKLKNFVTIYMSENAEEIITNFNYDDIAQENVEKITQKQNGWESIYQSFLAGNLS